MSNKEPAKILIGVTGPAGSGKTTFAQMLAAHGGELLKADNIAWELYERPRIHQGLKQRFGEKIFTQGKVARDKLGDIVFADPAALADLNRIIRPALVRKIKERIASAGERVVVLDAALLLDWDISFDLKIAVLASRPTLLARLENKGFSREKASDILASQRDKADFEKLCDVVVENEGTLADLERKATEIWQNRILPLVD